MSLFIENIKKEFFHYKALGDRTIEQLDDKELNLKSSSESICISQIVKHVNGNMLSRWPDFLNSDGEKNWRNRDDEFKHPLTTKEVIIESWEIGWRCLFDAIEALKKKI